MSTTIKAPSTFTGTSEWGGFVLEFVDGVAHTDQDLPAGLVRYFDRTGFTVDKPKPKPAPTKRTNRKDGDSK